MDAGSATVDQVKRLVGLLPDGEDVPLFVFDAGYDGWPSATASTTPEPRCWCASPPPGSSIPTPSPVVTGPSDAPGATGRVCALVRPSDLASPDAELTTSDRRYGAVTVQAWHNLHPKLHGRGRWRDCDEPPIITGSVIRSRSSTCPNRRTRQEDALAVVVR